MTYEEVARLALDAPQRAQQKWTELVNLLEMVDNLEPEKILELGVFQGGTMLAWSFFAAENAEMVGVDLPGGDFGGGFDPEQQKRIEKMAKDNQKIKLYARDSHLATTKEEVAEYGPFDFLFIDADHTYEGVKRDFELYSPLVRSGGLIALHDIVEHTKRPEVQVHKFWKELKKNYPKPDIFEFIDVDYPSDWNPWGGIGVIIT